MSKEQSETAQKTLAPEKLQSKQIEPANNPNLNKWAGLIANDIDKWADMSAQDVKKWAGVSTKDIENSDQSPTIKISRFGIKTARDVQTFLRSPAGDSVMAEIGNQLAAEKSLHEYEQLQLREKHLLMNRLKAAFFLWYIEKKAHAAAQQKEIILEQNQRAIKNSGQTPQPTPLRPSSERTSLMRSIADYNRAIQSYQNRQSTLEKEYKALNTKLSKLESETHMIKFKYDLYGMQLKDFNNTLEKLENAPTPKRVAELQAEVDSIQVEMNELQNQVDELIKLNRHDEASTLKQKHTSLSLKRADYLDELSTESKIQSQIDAIKTKMDEILDQVEELIQLNQDDEAALLMKTHTSLNLNLARHFDMLAVRKGDKHYVTEDGKIELDGKPVSFKDAHFILNKGEQIIKEGDKHYLLQPGQIWDQVKTDEKALKKASESFEQKKHELMVVENVVQHNEGLESNVNKEQITEVKTEITNNEKEQTLLQNQTTLIQAAKASAEYLLNNPNLDLPTPRPTISQGHSIPTPKPGFSPTVFYKNEEELEQFCKQPNARTLIKYMANQAPVNIRQEALKYLNAEFSKLQPSTAPIPTIAMQRMLQTLETMGVKAAKPSVTNIQQPLDRVKEAEKEVENDAPSPSRLTPLSTSPFK
ncbi:type IV secretion system protein [Legionella maioricensis]|uniref:LidA long coiled-coil domain-containing protein n=1 Tax=Legionella maioricensis TaxID=2896528 RepID=A0A9X2D1L3_9GAMM|nr:type IV secretion system protein [Legionella maioricensis]MCL9684420.1 hypothetical protein [Legionella maioricensis]MCL9687601.1 hypothetical protein [Legionella maioricensis]